MENSKSITKKIVIHAKPEKVFEVIKDVENWNLWTDSVNSISFHENSRFEIGGKATVTQPKLSPAVWTITGLNHNQSFTWKTKSLGVTITAIHSLESSPDGTIAELKTIYEGFLAGLLFKLTSKLTDKYMSMEINGLKAESEKR